jgi:hypothetical protein
MKKAICIPAAAILLPYFLLNSFLNIPPKKAVYKNKITITGQATNRVGRAAIESDSAGVYYLQGLHSWQHDWVNRRVKITGDFETASNDTALIKEAVVQLLD